MPVVHSPGAEIWWAEAGSGPAVLLIQGLGYPSDAWWRLVPALSEDLRVLTLDNRGVGRTGVPKTQFSIEAMADDAAAVVTAAGAANVHVFGASMGGLIAQELTLRHPRLVTSLILGCTSPGGVDAVAFSDSSDSFLRARANMSPREAAEASVPLVYADTTPRHRIDADIEVRMKIPTSATGYSAQLSAIFAYSGSFDRLSTVRVPTMILHGTDDRLVPPANAHMLAEAIPNARLEWLSGAGHIFTTDQTDRVVELVRGFTHQHSSPVVGHR